MKKTSSMSRDWASVCDMDNSTVKPQASVSSVPPVHTHADVSSSDSPTEFVNHGLSLWTQTRQRWVGSKKQSNQQIKDAKLSNRGFCIVDSFWPCSWNTTYESLLGSNKPFSQPVPLAEMVDFLVDIWEQDGMYD